MGSAALWKKIASLLLLVCFVLPLSKCNSQKRLEPVVGIVVDQPGAVRTPYVPVAPTVFYGYEILSWVVSDVVEGKFKDISFLCMWVVAFFAPAASLLIREPWRSGIHFFAAFPSLYVLQVITFIQTPLFGGLLALTCWSVLLILGASTVWGAFRERRLRS